MHPGQDWTHAVFCKQVDLQNKCKAMRRTFTRCDIYQTLSLCNVGSVSSPVLLEQGMIEKKTAFRLIIRKWWIIR
jgi:hypothetical protein